VLKRKCVSIAEQTATSASAVMSVEGLHGSVNVNPN